MKTSLSLDEKTYIEYYIKKINKIIVRDACLVIFLVFVLVFSVFILSFPIGA